jgi:hypothetical protein
MRLRRASESCMALGLGPGKHVQPGSRFDSSTVLIVLPRFPPIEW